MPVSEAGVSPSMSFPLCGEGNPRVSSSVRVVPSPPASVTPLNAGAGADAGVDPSAVGAPPVTPSVLDERGIHSWAGKLSKWGGETVCIPERERPLDDGS